MQNDMTATVNANGATKGRSWLARLVSRLRWWHALIAALFLSLYNDSVIILRVNHVGLIIKHADTWVPEFLPKWKSD